MGPRLDRPGAPLTGAATARAGGGAWRGRYLPDVQLQEDVIICASVDGRRERERHDDAASSVPSSLAGLSAARGGFA